MKKLFYLFLCLCICIVCTMAASAETYSGTCGENVVWTLDTESGEIVISGNGDMLDFASCSDAPWYKHRTHIKKVTVANGVTSVGDYAFDWVYKNLSEVVLADSVKTVNYGAFSYLTSLTTVDLGEGIETVGYYAFQHTSIEKLYVPASAKTIGSCAFRGCSSLADLTFAEGIEIIGDFAFNDCTSLKTVTIPDSVIELLHGAFAFCEALEEATIGNGLKELSSEVFRGCYLLEKVNIGSRVVQIEDDAFLDCYALTEITIPENVLTIDMCAFRGNYYLEKVTISPYTVFIHDAAFEDCENLTVYGYEPSAAKDYADKNGHTFVSLGASPFVAYGFVGDRVYWFLNGDGTLKICGEGETYEYNSSAKLPWYEYKGEIKSVEICSGVTTISGGAFFFYTALESVKIADTVTVIGDHAFCYTSISDIELPKSVIEIGYYAFRNCSNLTSVTIGREVKNIGEGAFGKCGEGFTIYGYKESAAETYAASEEISFVVLEATEDVDGDGEVTVRDVLAVLNCLLNREIDIDADMDGDRTISLIDVLRVLKAVVG